MRKPATIKPVAAQIVFPIKGLNVDAPRYAQPEGTSPDLLNVMPDGIGERFRGGPRAGTSKLYAANFSASHVAAMCETRRARLEGEINSGSASATDGFAVTATVNLTTYSSANWYESNVNGTDIPASTGPVASGVSPRAGTVLSIDATADNVRRNTGTQSRTSYAATYIGAKHATPESGFAVRATVQFGGEVPLVESNGLTFSAESIVGRSTKLMAQIRGPASVGGSAAVTGTATGGSSTTLVDSALVNVYQSHWLNGAVVTITGGTGSGSTGTVTGFTAATGTITVGSWSGTAPAASSTYSIANGAYAFRKQVVTLCCNRRFMCIFQGEYPVTNAVASGTGNTPEVRTTASLRPPGARDELGKIDSVWYYEWPSLLDATTDYTLEMRVNGTRAFGYLNGRPIVDTYINESATNAVTPNSSTDRYAGFAIGGRSAVGNLDTVDDFQIRDSVSALQSPESVLVYASGGNVYVGDIGAAPVYSQAQPTKTSTLSGQSPTETTISTLRNDTTIPIQFAAARDNVFCVDGNRTLRIDVQRRTVFVVQNTNPNPQTTSGTLTGQYINSPILNSITGGTVPLRCRLAAMWRDRLVLAAPAYAPQLFFMSCIGRYMNFQTSETAVDPVTGIEFGPAAGFFGSTSTGAPIGEPIRALMPFSDDVLILGCESSLVQLSGDPRRGGTQDIITATVGVHGPDAWCQSPDGTIYFVGTGGFYKIVPSSLPVSVSAGRVDTIFSAVNRSTHRVSCVYDKSAGGVWIFLTPYVSGATTHYFYSEETDGFFPVSFATAAHNPYCSISYDGDDPAYRTMLMGCGDGYVRRFDSTQTADDGVARATRAVMGPVRPYGDNLSAILTGTEVILGEASVGTFACTLDVFGATHEYEGTLTPSATNGCRKITRDFSSGGRKTRWEARLAGGAFFFKLSSSASTSNWSMEKLIASFEDGGQQRLR